MRSGAKAEQDFPRLLAPCEGLAPAWGVARLMARVNTARRAAYRTMLGSGFRPEILGLAMDRPDEAAYN